MVVFDTSVLALALDPNAKGVLDPATGLPLEHAQARMTNLIGELSASKTRILIPTPVVAEYLVRGGADRAERLRIISESRVFVVAPFDTRAAVECAELLDGLSEERRQVLTENETKAKLRFDRQIIAIAKARGASTIYTGDSGLSKCAKRNGLKAVMPWELAPPPIPPQGAFAFDSQNPHAGTW